MRKFNKFHIVNQRPWPLLTSMQISNLIIIITYNNNIIKTKLINFYCLIRIVIIPLIWWKNTFIETNKEGIHQQKTIKGIKTGILLFIVSEILFFFSFFWVYIHTGIRPRIEVGQIWPPTEIKSFNPINVPLLNTIILVRSGFSITWSHHLILKNKLKKSLKALKATLILGLYFSTLQIIEYNQAEFSLRDSSYGAIFFIATGFHGIHVIIGSSFIMINILYINKIFLTKNHHLGFELAAWYWHFVDIIWLLLYLLVYWWGI